ncbi:MAG: flagellar hook-basal body protein [Bdellovibrionota bacterium]
MATGLWTSATGAAAQSQNVDIIANNLANTDTAAYKKDLPTFKEYLATVERSPEVMDIPRGPIKDKEFYPLDGRDQAFVVMDGTHTNFRQGSLRVTQGPLDLALDGPGFFEVSTPNGIRYTRQGSLKMATDGRLVTNDGYPVLASQPGGLAGVQPAQGPVPAAGAGAEVARMINLRDRGSNISISPAGEIYAGEDLIAKLNVVEFQNLGKLKKIGGGLFENKDTLVQPMPAAKTAVRQGLIETSNVNPIEEMTNLIKANRLFEHDLKAMKTYGELLSKEANDIGKL